MAKTMNKEQRIALLMLKATPQERKNLFRRMDELHDQGVRLDKSSRNELQRYR